MDISLETLEALVRVQCTAEECAAALGCSEDTIDRRLKEEGEFGFAEYRKKHLTAGKISLRRAQFKAALKGNPTMLIWLGKQYLDQTDRTATDLTSSDGSMTPQGVTVFELPNNGRG